VTTKKFFSTDRFEPHGGGKEDNKLVDPCYRCQYQSRSENQYPCRACYFNPHCDLDEEEGADYNRYLSVTVITGGEIR